MGSLLFYIILILTFRFLEIEYFKQARAMEFNEDYRSFKVLHIFVCQISRLDSKQLLKGHWMMCPQLFPKKQLGFLYH